MRYVKNPNLPENAGIVMIGEKYREILKEPLENKGLNVLCVPENPDVDKRLSSHADLSVMHMGGNKIALAAYLKGSDFAERLRQIGFELNFSEVKQKPNYPFDAALNMCICGNNLIYNPETADLEIADILTKGKGINFVTSKQGYSKCSVCLVNENVIITSDAGIHKRAVAKGIESLKISPGFIDLDGFDYGFIGGASFKISDDILAFTGRLGTHPDKDIILNFLGLHNMKLVYITDYNIFDVGSIIQIVEKDSCE